MNENWEVTASPHFSKAYCPKHHNPMKELQNGFFGNPVWYCSECKYPYKLEFVKMRKWSKEALDKQINE